MSERDGSIDPSLMAIYMERSHVGPGDNVEQRLPLDNNLRPWLHSASPVYEAYDSGHEIVLPEADGVPDIVVVPNQTTVAVVQLLRTALGDKGRRAGGFSTWSKIFEHDIQDLNRFDVWADEEAVRQGLDRPWLTTASDDLLEQLVPTTENPELQATHPTRNSWLGRLANRGSNILGKISFVDISGKMLRPAKASEEDNN